METSLTEQLGKNYTSTSYEEDCLDYILTKYEEETVLRNEMERLKKHRYWQMWYKGVKQQTIDDKISCINFEEVINKLELFLAANKRKHMDIQAKEIIRIEREKEIKKDNELRIQCDANYMFNLMAKTSFYKFGKNIIKNNDTIKLIKVICFFLSNDERFVNELGFDFKKGLWIRGICGLGKTYLLTCVKDNILKPINIYSMIDIYNSVKDDRDFKIDYSKLVYLDDVGTEENSVVKNYGTDINFFKNFIESYYLNSKRYDRLIISTNVDFNEIEKRYGVRARSRIKDMFNIINVTGKDLRG